MELVFITHGNILDLSALPPLWSWLTVIGGVYGAVRLARDLWRGFSAIVRALTTPPADKKP